ncbi:hypothetical protein GYMLUDRAFT_241061 [Collybiopsis luxurians FD-317 M1]|nr:hypothetical protein GYMLUDRAFT_241061 [Collybiopsis luxurians FD-317 M1]
MSSNPVGHESLCDTATPKSLKANGSPTPSPNAELEGTQGLTPPDKDSHLNKSSTKSDLNNDECAFLDDVDEDHMESVPSNNKHEEVCKEGDQENSHGNMLVEDISSSSKLRRAQPTKKCGSRFKVAKDDFRAPELVILAKQCTHMGTCILNMFPQDDWFCWDLFSEELDRLVDKGTAEGLVKELNLNAADGEKQEDFIHFMGYSVYFDMGKEAQIRVSQFFNVPGMLSSDEIISTVNWLCKDCKYHEGEIDVIARTTNGHPFSSPLLVLMLQGYLVKEKPKQDELLVDCLKQMKQIPLHLIAMVTVLIGHSLQEYTSGHIIT